MTNESSLPGAAEPRRGVRSPALKLTAVFSMIIEDVREIGRGVVKLASNFTTPSASVVACQEPMTLFGGLRLLPLREWIWKFGPFLGIDLTGGRKLHQ